MHSPAVFQALWARVATRETIGIAIELERDQFDTLKHQLHRHRPPGCVGYTLARTADPTIAFLLRADIDPNAARDTRMLAEANNDLPPTEPEILPPYIDPRDYGPELE
jgi:hypothetical protein